MYPYDIPHMFLHRELKEKIWMCNIRHDDVEEIVKGENAYWRDVLKAWCKVHYVCMRNNPVLWLNSDIKVGGRMLWNSEAEKRGLLYVGDLMEKGRFISQAKVEDQYGLSVMEYNAIKTAVPREVKQKCMENPQATPTDEVFAKVMHTEKVSKMVYEELSPTEVKQTKRKEEQWKEELGAELSVPQEVSRAFKLTTVAKYVSFQYRLLVRAIVTNIQLAKWKIRNSDECSFCEKYRETVWHMLYDCEVVANIWHAFPEICCEMNLNEPTVPTYENVIRNNVSQETSVNFLCLVVKQYVYRCRCQKRTVTRAGVVKELYAARAIEKYYAIKENRLRKFNKQKMECQ